MAIVGGEVHKATAYPIPAFSQCHGRAYVQSPSAICHGRGLRWHWEALNYHFEKGFSPYRRPPRYATEYSDVYMQALLMEPVIPFTRCSCLVCDTYTANLPPSNSTFSTIPNATYYAPLTAKRGPNLHLSLPKVRLSHPIVSCVVRRVNTTTST